MLNSSRASVSSAESWRAAGSKAPSFVPDRASPSGRNFITVNRACPTSSSLTKKSWRVTTKCAAPTPVCFSGLTDSSTRVERTRSPSTSGRSCASSELTAIADVKPARSRVSNAPPCGSETFRS